MSVTTRHTVAEVSTAVSYDDLRVSLSWDSNDPHAVTMDVHTTKGTARWLLAWELLAEGVHTPAGIGDIHIRPGDPGFTKIVLMPGSPEQAVLRVPSADTIGFLADTWCAEPRPVTDAEIAAHLAQWEAA